MYSRTCITCNTKFETDRSNKTYCSIRCKKISYRKRVYERKDGDWEWYFKGLLNNREDRKKLTPDLLVKLLENQNYKCALSGVKMTCKRIQGKTNYILTNASIDRINPGKEYNYDNIQIVCRAINSFRGNMSINEFINWCNKVTEHAVRKQKKTI